MLVIKKNNKKQKPDNLHNYWRRDEKDKRIPRKK